MAAKRVVGQVASRGVSIREAVDAIAVLAGDGAARVVGDHHARNRGAAGGSLAQSAARTGIGGGIGLGRAVDTVIPAGDRRKVADRRAGESRAAERSPAFGRGLGQRIAVDALAVAADDGAAHVVGDDNARNRRAAGARTMFGRRTGVRTEAVRIGLRGTVDPIIVAGDRRKVGNQRRGARRPAKRRVGRVWRPSRGVGQGEAVDALVVDARDGAAGVVGDHNARNRGTAGGILARGVQAHISGGISLRDAVDTGIPALDWPRVRNRRGGARRAAERTIALGNGPGPGVTVDAFAVFAGDSRAVGDDNARDRGAAGAAAWRV